MNTYSPIPELNLLQEFEDSLEGEEFSEGFELFEYGRPEAGLAEWLSLETPDPSVRRALDQLIPFAHATGSGSFYALWRCDDRTDLATLPVIFFGDEGGLDVVAQGLRDLFQLLALDDEWLLPWDPTREHSAGHPAYLAWLESTFGLTMPDSPDPIVNAARHEYGRRFLDWALQSLSRDLEIEGLTAEPV